MYVVPLNHNLPLFDEIDDEKEETPDFNDQFLDDNYDILPYNQNNIGRSSSLIKSTEDKDQRITLEKYNPVEPYNKHIENVKRSSSLTIKSTEEKDQPTTLQNYNSVEPYNQNIGNGSSFTIKSIEKKAQHTTLEKYNSVDICKDILNKLQTLVFSYGSPLVPTY